VCNIFTFHFLSQEILLPVLYLVILSFLVSQQGRKTYPEVSESYETPQNVLKSLMIVDPLKDNETGLPHDIRIIHSSAEYAMNVSENMEKVWLGYSNIRPDQIFNFTHYSTEAELMDAYYSGTVEMAIVLSENSKDLSYAIRLNPDVPQPVPPASTKTVDLETCRGLDKQQNGLEQTRTCPVNGYYYSNFLALQYLVDQALIMVRFCGTNNQFVTIPCYEKIYYSMIVNLQETLGLANLTSPRVTVENYPKESYTADMSTMLRIIIPLYFVIPLAQFINILLILIVTEKESKIKDGLKMIGVSDGAYW
jgi:hypothetical protein